MTTGRPDIKPFPPGHASRSVNGSPAGKRSLFSLSLSLSLFSILPATAQPLSINASNQPLNEVVYSLITENNIQCSYNDRLLSRHNVTLTATFTTFDRALDHLLTGLPLTYHKEEDIYLIIKKKPVTYPFSGRITDRHSGEALPFAHLVTQSGGIITGPDGRFSFEAADNTARTSISYLGYYILDTLLQSGTSYITLAPSAIGLSEVVIEGKTVAYSMETGDAPGQVRLNQVTARKLPGNGDNAVFNFLRLQPGILAAGEQSSDLIIWGSYEGHSKVVFDGFTLYGMKNFNDNISAVNPYMAKDIMVLKGGYGAEYGDRVGGIVNITGVDGNRNSATVNMNINNMTLNGMTSVPVNDRSAVAVAFRRTYYNLYDPDDLNMPRITNDQRTDIYVYPDYTFGDFNLKYSGTTKRSASVAASLYRGSDRFGFAVDRTRQLSTVRQEEDESNQQNGGSLSWSRSLGRGVRTEATLYHSSLNTGVERTQTVTRNIRQTIAFQQQEAYMNSVSESGARNTWRFTAGRSHQLSAGIDYLYNTIRLSETVNDSTPMESADQGHRISAFLSDRISIGTGGTLEAGVRVDKPLHTGGIHLQPRISAEYHPGERWKGYLAWGIYSQFISKTSVLDDYGNYRYYWALADNADVPVLQGVHHVAGLSYSTKPFSAGAEVYYKTTAGLTRYVYLVRERLRDVFNGTGKSYGVDLFLKGSLGRHEGWLGYSAGKTTEHFEYFPDDLYRPAPHDQRHEVKGAVIIDLHPLTFSANYVYGSGFVARRTLLVSEDAERFPYSRCDVALTWKITAGKVALEAGGSVLNLFNRENIKYSNFTRVPSDQLNSVNIHAEAVPFTPAIYLNIVF